VGTKLASSYPAIYSYPSGSRVELRAVPRPGFRFTGWSGAATGSSDTLSLLITCNLNITANFAPITLPLRLTTSPGGGGEVIVESPEPAPEYAWGTEVVIRAVASEGYRFSHWSGAASGSANPTTVHMDSAKEVSHFAKVAAPWSGWWWLVIGVGAVGLLT